MWQIGDICALLGHWLCVPNLKTIVETFKWLASHSAHVNESRNTSAQWHMFSGTSFASSAKLWSGTACTWGPVYVCARQGRGASFMDTNAALFGVTGRVGEER